MNKRTPAERRIYERVRTLCRKNPGVWYAFIEVKELNLRDRATFLRMLELGDFDNDAMEADRGKGKIRHRKPNSDLRGQLTLAQLLAQQRRMVNG